MLVLSAWMEALVPCAVVVSPSFPSLLLLFAQPEGEPQQKTKNKKQKSTAQKHRATSHIVRHSLERSKWLAAH
jgi:hypothetical protein